MRNITADFEKGIDFFNEGDYFEAHEIWEDIWMGTKDTGEKSFIQGMIMIAAAFHHYTRQEYQGAAQLIRSGLEHLEGSEKTVAGFDKDAFVKSVRLFYNTIMSVETPVAEGSFPKIRKTAGART